MQNYAADVLAKIDERFSLDSKTDLISNKGIELSFEGVNSVTIYDIDTVTENDYVRAGTMRYGQLVEVGTGTQTFVLSQDKSFALSIDRGNREDSKMVLAIEDAVKRQVREVSVPTVDKYRLAVLVAYAQANGQQPTDATLSKTTVFGAILTERAALQNALVPLEDIVIFVHPVIEQYLWQDAEFKVACDRTKADLATGVIGTVMGMTIVTVPTTYFPTSKINFLMVSKKVLISPTKFNSIRTGDGFPFGIDGFVAQGRRYYDAFIPANKGVAIRVHEQA